MMRQYGDQVGIGDYPASGKKLVYGQQDAPFAPDLRQRVVYQAAWTAGKTHQQVIRTAITVQRQRLLRQRMVLAHHTDVFPRVQLFMSYRRVRFAGQLSDNARERSNCQIDVAAQQHGPRFAGCQRHHPDTQSGRFLFDRSHQRW